MPGLGSADLELVATGVCFYGPVLIPEFKLVNSFSVTTKTLWSWKGPVGVLQAYSLFGHSNFFWVAYLVWDGVTATRHLWKLQCN